MSGRVYRVRFGPVDTGESTHRDFTGSVQLAFGDSGVTIVPDDGEAVHVAFHKPPTTETPQPVWAHFWRCRCPDERGTLRQVSELLCFNCGAKRPPVEDFDDDNPARPPDDDEY